MQVDDIMRRVAIASQYSPAGSCVSHVILFQSLQCRKLQTACIIKPDNYYRPSIQDYYSSNEISVFYPRYYQCYNIFTTQVLFACVPPAHIAGGWLCFCVSLGVIAMVTAIIGDMASILGLLLGIKDSVTAITLGIIKKNAYFIPSISFVLFHSIPFSRHRDPSLTVFQLPWKPFTHFVSVSLETLHSISFSHHRDPSLTLFQLPWRPFNHFVSVALKTLHTLCFSCPGNLIAGHVCQ